MKKFLVLFFFILFSLQIAFAQSTRAIVTDTNGTLLWPTNFFLSNSITSTGPASFPGGITTGNITNKVTQWFPNGISIQGAGQPIGLFTDANGNETMNTNQTPNAINYGALGPQIMVYGATNSSTHTVAWQTNVMAIAFLNTGLNIYVRNGLVGDFVENSLVDPSNIVYQANPTGALFVQPGTSVGKQSYTRGVPNYNGPAAELGPTRTIFNTTNNPPIPTQVTNSLANLYQREGGQDRLWSVYRGMTNNVIINIVCTGDSKMYGSNPNNVSQQLTDTNFTIPQLLYTNLTQMGFNVVVWNDGQPGMGAQYWLTNQLAIDLSHFSGAYNLMIQGWGYGDAQGDTTVASWLGVMSNCMYTARQSFGVSNLAILSLTENGSYNASQNNQYNFAENIQLPVVKQLADQFQTAWIDVASIVNDTDHSTDPWMDNCCGVSPTNHVHQLELDNVIIADKILRMIAPESVRRLVTPRFVAATELQGGVVYAVGSANEVNGAFNMTWNPAFGGFLDALSITGGQTNEWLRGNKIYFGGGPGATNVEIDSTGTVIIPGPVKVGSGNGISPATITISGSTTNSGQGTMAWTQGDSTVQWQAIQTTSSIWQIVEYLNGTPVWTPISIGTNGQVTISGAGIYVGGLATLPGGILSSGTNSFSIMDAITMNSGSGFNTNNFTTGSQTVTTNINVGGTGSFGAANQVNIGAGGTTNAAGSFTHNVAVNGNYSVLSSDKFIIEFATTNATITLPAGVDQELRIVYSPGGTNLTLQCTGGTVTYLASVKQPSVIVSTNVLYELQADSTGTNWYIGGH